MKILSYDKYIIENKYDGFYIIGWGLGGGFGGIQNFEVIKSSSKEHAEKEAYQNSVELYSTYDGMHGLRSVDDIMEEDGVDSDEAETIYNDEMESWLEYSAEPYTKERENKVKDYHYTNRWGDELDSINESYNSFQHFKDVISNIEDYLKDLSDEDIIFSMFSLQVNPGVSIVKNNGKVNDIKIKMASIGKLKIGYQIELWSPGHYKNIIENNKDLIANTFISICSYLYKEDIEYEVQCKFLDVKSKNSDNYGIYRTNIEDVSKESIFRLLNRDFNDRALGVSIIFTGNSLD